MINVVVSCNRSYLTMSMISVVEPFPIPPVVLDTHIHKNITFISVVTPYSLMDKYVSQVTCCHTQGYGPGYLNVCCIIYIVAGVQKE